MLGLDPDPRRLWPAADGRQVGAGDKTAPTAVRVSEAVVAHCRALIAAAGPECVAIKPQLACFEALGATGWDALAQVVETARSADLLVIADGKRGDIGISAEAYGRAFFGAWETPFGTVDSLGVDALTANPYLGEDSLEPLLAGARESGGGLFVLARTSNPGAKDFQELPLGGDVGVGRGEGVGGRGSSGGRGTQVVEAVAEMISRLGSSGLGVSGLSDVGAVVGATAPEQVARLRELMPHTVFLIPGVGAQGGRVEDLAEAFVPGPAGALISASRSIVYAHERDGSSPADGARREAAKLREAAWEMSHQI